MTEIGATPRHGAYSRGGVRDRYYLTRDSAPDGTLSDTIDVWLTEPVRHRTTYDGGLVWVSSDERTYRVCNHGGPHWRQLTLAECTQRFAAVPESDGVYLLLAEVA